MILDKPIGCYFFEGEDLPTEYKGEPITEAVALNLVEAGEIELKQIKRDALLIRIDTLHTTDTEKHTKHSFVAGTIVCSTTMRCLVVDMNTLEFKPAAFAALKGKSV